MSEAFRWPRARLGKLLIFYGSGATPRGGKNAYRAAGVPLVRSMNVHDLRFERSSLAFIDNTQAQLLNRVQIMDNDVLLNITGASVARCCLASSLAVGGRVNQHVMILRTDPSVADARWIARALAGPYKSSLLAIAGSGATREALTRSDIESFEVSLPTVDYQSKVADLLDAYDLLIENNRRRIEVLEEMARLLYREWFVHFRFPGHEDVELVDSDLGPIPKGWSTGRLVEACSLVMGQSPKSEYYNDVGMGLPFHQGVSDFGNWFPTHTKWTTVDKRVAEPGDLLFSVRAPVGRINVAPDRLVVGRGLSAIRALDNHQCFLLMQIKNKFVVEDSIGGGTIFNAVTKKDMESILLLKPASSVVRQFEALVGPMVDLLSRLIQQNEVLREGRDLLLPRLVSGELDLSELDLDLELATV
ncbi:MAG: hypothetical protein OXE79_10135 [Acidimicrobiaceae bacterium]|nr:hypothetical protein [Acidimicrobiaceae bacterium]MCY4279273.1 hypothetical protein [Acidimicrobiaceae bacterium]MCY4294657.1 hypothetical protein [Acidimicrobiaceae bacterium]